MTSKTVFLIAFITMLLMTLTTVIAGIISIKYGYRTKQLRFIPYYCFASVAVDLKDIYERFLHNPKNYPHSHATGNLFIMLEFILFSVFLLKVTSTPGKKRIVLVTTWAFILVQTGLWICKPDPYFFRITDQFLFSDSVLLLIPCFFYFYDLFRSPGETDLKNDPRFWVVTAIFFYNCTSIPLFFLVGLLANYPDYSKLFVSLNFILYIFIFLLFIKASLCKSTG